MTLFVEDFYAYLAAANTAAGARFYPQSLPQQPTFPAVTYLQVSAPRDTSHSGLSRLRHPRYQLDCWSDDYLEAHRLAEEVLYAISIYAASRGGVTVQASFVEDEGRDNYDPETARHWISVDVVIWHTK